MMPEPDGGASLAAGAGRYSDAWVENMVAVGSRFGVGLSAGQARLFARHGRELALWNKKINLTAVRDPGQVALKHFADSLAALKYLPQRGNVLDLGSGAGFPGIPIKVMRPEINLVLVDGAGKKVNFLKHVIRTLGLERAKALHLRAEAMAADPHWQGYFDHVVCRALGTVMQVACLALPLMAPAGRLLVWKAAQWQEKEADWPCKAGADRCTISVAGNALKAHVHDYRLPGSDLRQIVELVLPPA